MVFPIQLIDAFDVMGFPRHGIPLHGVLIIINFLSPKTFNMAQHGRSHLVRPPKRRLSSFMFVPGIGKSTMASSNMTLKMTLKADCWILESHQVV